MACSLFIELHRTRTGADQGRGGLLYAMPGQSSIARVPTPRGIASG
jgi:hypothetical protein